MMNEVYVLYNGGKLRAAYASKADAVMDRERLIGKGYKDVRVQDVQLQPQTREPDPLDPETIEALKQCVERS